LPGGLRHRLAERNRLLGPSRPRTVCLQIKDDAGAVVAFED